MRLKTLQSLELGRINAILRAKNEKMVGMRALGKWNRLIRGLLERGVKKTAADEKIHRMIVLGRWRILSRRAVRRQAVLKSWTTLVRGMYANNGDFGLNLQNSLATDVLVKRLGPSERRDKLAKLEISTKWADLVRKLLQKE